jgi:hypothetical protein
MPLSTHPKASDGTKKPVYGRRMLAGGNAIFAEMKDAEESERA